MIPLVGVLLCMVLEVGGGVSRRGVRGCKWPVVVGWCDEVRLCAVMRCGKVYFWQVGFSMMMLVRLFGSLVALPIHADGWYIHMGSGDVKRSF